MSFASNNTYGEYKHKLSISEMPAHRHGTNDGWKGMTKYSYRDATDKEYYTLMNSKINTSNGIYGDDYSATNYVGGGNSHNNVQPSICVYFWKRTA